MAEIGGTIETMIGKRRLDWPSACLFVTADPDWKKKIFVGGCVLLLPLIGWPAILGYRKEAILRLKHGTSPVLPDWNAGLWHFTAEGLKAVGVINAYYLPIYAWFAFRFFSAPELQSFPWFALACGCALFPIFSTLVVPVVLLYCRFLAPAGVMSTGELAALSAVFVFATFVIPAGFLNVTRTEKLLSAFNLARAWSLICRHFRAYCEAWIGSGLMSLVGHLCFPFSPWGVVWCYLGIVYSFNEIPLTGDARDTPADLQQSWFRRFQSEHWTRYDITRRGWFEQHRLSVPGDQNSGFTALSLGLLKIPIR